ncbi:RNA polymerase sigma factor [Pseudomonas yamanorum]|uniref:RNA polymerase sigma factor n=1 Tax=Pseudomonas yamanorum TaxID=515393 RepID=UPI00087D288B|nr:sigma-70 family RNA polymerase sigma factor [Pseudomonas yamanorum]SDT99498.1 RNA polymerase sigma factor, sigma-70 family [Pseudomonas yamanorum]
MQQKKVKPAERDMPITFEQQVVRVFLSSYNHESLRKFIRSRVMNPEDAEDLLQGTYVEALRNCNKFNGDSKPETWMFGIALNLIRSHFRRAYTRPPLCELDTLDMESNELAFDLDRQVDALRLLERTARATAALSPDMRRVLTVMLENPGNYHALAERLGIPIGTVRSRLSRARAMLRREVFT